MGIWPGAFRIVEMTSRYTPRRVRRVMAKEMKPIISEAQITLSGTAMMGRAERKLSSSQCGVNEWVGY